MDKLLLIHDNNLEFGFYSNSNLVENPVPVLWRYKGFYYWIPVEIIKNEIQNCKIAINTNNTLSKIQLIKLTLQQAYPLRQDVGRILESLNNNNNQPNNS